MSNPQIDAIRKNLAENPLIPEGASLEQMRTGMDSMGEMLPVPDGVSVTSVDAGGVPSDWVGSSSSNSAT